MPQSNFTGIPTSTKPRTRLNFGESTLCSTQKMAAFTIYECENNIEKSSTKRQLETDDYAPEIKRSWFPTSTSTPKSDKIPEPESPISSIIKAVNKLSTNTDLVADDMRARVLPTIVGKHPDLNAISPQTMCKVLDGHYDIGVKKLAVIDCRYPYEFEGGHIKGAINLYTKDLIKEYFNKCVSSSTQDHVLIFHCEFSSERGPKMYRFLRTLDRQLNQDNYPFLNFPEIYLLQGGYKEFFHAHKDKCYPQTYKPMLHKEHKNDLRHFRVKSKSWSAGDRPAKQSLKGTQLRLRF